MTTDAVLINSQINIRETAENAGAQFYGNRSKCPIHGGDNPQAFEIFDGGRAWKCHTKLECNRFGNDGIGLIRALNNWTFPQLVERYAKPIDPLEATRRAADNAKRIEIELQEKIDKANKAIEELRRARKWIEDHDNMTDTARDKWEMRGIPECWQDYWWLGYRENFSYSHAGNWYTSPSLTIPIFQCKDTEPRQVRHRILSPIDPQDKYRPERAGIEAMPFLCDRDAQLDAFDRVIVVEGEIKAAVTYLTLDRPKWQVVGIPGKQSWSKLADELKDRKDTVIMLDPDAKADAVRMARSIGGAKVVDLPEKIDDMIIKYGLKRNWIEVIFSNARFIK